MPGFSVYLPDGLLLEGRRALAIVQGRRTQDIGTSEVVQAGVTLLVVAVMMREGRHVPARMPAEHVKVVKDILEALLVGAASAEIQAGLARGAER